MVERVEGVIRLVVERVPTDEINFTILARSAIQSMRIPTDEMMAAALKADPRFQWDVMIRAALGERL